MSERLHDSIKYWLISLGQEEGYEAWTTDLQNRIEVSKFRNAIVKYRPDVVWKNKRNREKVFFEVIFENDYRQVVGMMFLASRVEDFTKMFFIRPTEYPDYWKEIETFLRYTFRKDGIVRTRYQPTFIIFDKSLKEDEIKEKVTETLKKDDWID
jgi:hypothetical protein